MRVSPIHIRPVSSLLIGLVIASGCGSGNEAGTPAGPPTAEVADQTSVDTPDSLAFEADEPAVSEASIQNLVEFEAAWQCDLSRFAVKELAELDEMLLAHRATFGVTDDAYADFQRRLTTDADLRSAVADETSECLDAGEPVQL